jgi:hypothetical protein
MEILIILILYCEADKNNNEKSQNYIQGRHFGDFD